MTAVTEERHLVPKHVKTERCDAIGVCDICSDTTPTTTPTQARRFCRDHTATTGHPTHVDSLRREHFRLVEGP